MKRPWAGPREAAKQGSGDLLDIIDRVFDGQDFFRGVIGDFAAEFFLEGHHEFDRIEAVGAQIVNKTGAVRYFVLVDTQMFDDDLLNPCGDITTFDLSDKFKRCSSLIFNL